MPEGCPSRWSTADDEEGDFERDQRLLSPLGLKDTVIFADQLMYTGFEYSTRSGVLDRRQRHGRSRRRRRSIEVAEAEVKEIEQQYSSGLVTQGELQQGDRHLVAGERPGRQGHDG